MAHQGLNDLLRHLVLNQVHRKRIPKRFGSDGADGKRDAVTFCSLNRLTYPAAGGVFAPDIPESAPAAGCTVANHSRSRWTKAGSVRGTARGGLSRISASAIRSACCSSFVGRPRRRDRLPARFLRPALFERAEHHKRRGERGARERVVQHEVSPGEGQDLVEASAGVPQGINEQAFAEICHL